jgi:hypothetical protein
MFHPLVDVSAVVVIVSVHGLQEEGATPGTSGAAAASRPANRRPGRRAAAGGQVLQLTTRVS